ncbi:MAG: RecQ family ATP-dependent DNA helicase [Bdellovibrionaceae bacterium]|nr:RecQ family ATP-dependent DNA helicase [Pseudobdellovibrionaceae bacterium]
MLSRHDIGGYPGLMDLTKLLHENFPYSGFRSGQLEVLSRLMAGDDLLALMPTGGGKSLCFQFPAKVRAGMVLVLSPLIALMQDQVQKATDLGIPSSFLASVLSREERQRRINQLARGRFRLFFVTPERFRKEDFKQALSQNQIQLLVVDEAHCISQWGHDFRPDYSRIGELRRSLGSPQVLALTATATPKVQEEICSQLGISQVFRGGIERDNLSLRVLDVHGTDGKIKELIPLLLARPGATIVYFALIETLLEVSRNLFRQGIPHLRYHGEMESGQRRKALQEFMNEEAPLMLATPAFGLGIDKANVRMIVHFEVPGSLEAYYQEAGRAGRDGLPSQALLLFDEEDISIQMEFLRWSYPDDEFVLRTFRFLKDRSDEVRSSGIDWLREQLSFRNKRDYRVESALRILERLGCVEHGDGGEYPFVPVREPTKNDFSAENNSEQLKRAQMRLLQMLRWAKDYQTCRLQGIYRYFGLTDSADCGRCDVCEERS